MNTKYKVINDNGSGVYEIVGNNKSQIHYYVNEQKKTVVAAMDDTKNELLVELNNLWNKFFPTIWEDPIYDLLENKNICFLKKSYRGKAHIVGEDVFDLETGMTIAREHMLADYYTDKAKTLAAITKLVSKFFGEMLTKSEISDFRAQKFYELSQNYFEMAHNFLEKSES